MPFNGAKLKSQLAILFLLPGNTPFIHHSTCISILFIFQLCLKIFISFSFVPPENFNLAVLTLELEFVKKGNRNEEVSLFSLSLCLNFFIHLFVELINDIKLLNVSLLGFVVRCCCTCTTHSEKVH